MIQLSIETPNAPENLEHLLFRIADACFAAEGTPAGIAFGRLVDDETIRQINSDFRGIDSPTDVLSFPSIEYSKGRTAKDCLKRLLREKDPETRLIHYGDFAISLPTAIRQSKEYGHSLSRELCYLTAHSLFHLMGYDHMVESDKKVMRAKEEEALRGFSFD